MLICSFLLLILVYVLLIVSLFVRRLDVSVQDLSSGVALTKAMVKSCCRGGFSFATWGFGCFLIDFCVFLILYLIAFTLSDGCIGGSDGSL